jgi:hypothetical protein
MLLGGGEKRSPRGSPGGGGGGSESGGSSSSSGGKKRNGGGGGDELGSKKLAAKSGHGQVKPAHQQTGVSPHSGTVDPVFRTSLFFTLNMEQLLKKIRHCKRFLVSVLSFIFYILYRTHLYT